MAKRAVTTQYQHEPLIPPDGWNEAARRFVMRVNDLFTRVFRKQGELERRIKALEEVQSNDE